MNSGKMISGHIPYEFTETLCKPEDVKKSICFYFNLTHLYLTLVVILLIFQEMLKL